MNYTIIRGTLEDLDRAEEARIADNPWNSTYLPDSRFKIVFDETKGFYARLWSYEKNPRVTYTEPGGEVCEDSCLELFLNFAPQKTTSFINFEMNACGAYLFGIGPDRYERGDLALKVMPTVSARILDDRWEVTLFIPLESIEEVYGKCDFKSGYVIRGNAFKCGDLTESPHWLAWSPMNPDVVDFHRSDRFGTLLIAE